MSTFELWIPGPPVTWSRAGRKRMPNGHVLTFENEKGQAWKSTFILLAQDALRRGGEHAPLFQHPTMLRIVVVCCLQLPTSEHRKREPAPASWALGKKDWDNLGKLVGDAGNGLLWADDRQIVAGQVVKVKMAQGEPPGMFLLAEAVPDLRLDEASVYLDRARRVAGLVAEPVAERRIG